MLRRTLALVAALTLTGCASIISRSDWPVTFTSPQPGVDFTVRDEKGVVRVAAKTPTTATLASGHGWFGRMDYVIETEHGTRTLRPKLNGWYLGNLVFGGLLGLLIVDPATGAMFRLPDRFDVVEPERAAPVQAHE